MCSCTCTVLSWRILSTSTCMALDNTAADLTCFQDSFGDCYGGFSLLTIPTGRHVQLHSQRCANMPRIMKGLTSAVASQTPACLAAGLACFKFLSTARRVCCAMACCISSCLLLTRHSRSKSRTTSGLICALVQVCWLP